MNRKQLTACFILSYIFVIEAMLVCVTNSMGTSQFIFVFSSMLLSCQEIHQLLNGLFNLSCWSFAEWPIALFLVKAILWLYLKFCSYHHHPPSPGQVPTHPCTHTHSHAHTCVYAKLQKDRKRIGVGSSIRKLWNPRVTTQRTITSWGPEFEFFRSCAILADEFARFSEH